MWLLFSVVRSTAEAMISRAEARQVKVSSFERDNCGERQERGMLVAKFEVIDARNVRCPRVYQANWFPSSVRACHGHMLDKTTDRRRVESVDDD